MLDVIGAIPLVRAIASALVQFLWVGTIIGGVAAVALTMLRRHAASLRYGVACGALALMVAVPVVSVLQAVRAADDVHVAAAARADARGTVPAAVPNAASGLSIVRATTGAWLPSVFLIWLAGVTVLSIRLVRSGRRVWQLRRSARAFDVGEWPARVRELAARLRVRPGWRLVESALVDGPGVIGVFHPVIVLPSGVLAQLSAAQLEAILAHELAHIRRADYLVNALQCIAEVLLFFHPVVWWISHRIRAEREFCCDDEVIAASVDRVEYASALASLEQLRSTSAPALGAADGDLLNRIRRVLDVDVVSKPQFTGGTAMFAITSVALVVMSTQLLGTSELPSMPMPNAPRVVEQAPPTHVRTTRLESVTANSATRRQARDASQPAPQAVRGGIAGRVTDAHGGTIPGATITITSPVVPGARTLATTATGRFNLDEVVPGDYVVVVSIPGFRVSKSFITVKPNDTVNLAIRLEVGTLSETITVRSNAASAPNTANAPPAPANSREYLEAAGYFEAAKSYYAQGRLAEAEAVTAQALEYLRAQMSQRQLVTSLPDQTGAIRVGGDIKEPKKIKDVKPAYPPDALAARVGGIVVMEATIGKDGSVTDARVLRSIAMLDEAALSAVRQWRFTPTLLNGQPVEVIMTVTVNFTPQ